MRGIARLRGSLSSGGPKDSFHLAAYGKIPRLTAPGCCVILSLDFGYHLIVRAPVNGCSRSRGADFIFLALAPIVLTSELHAQDDDTLLPQLIPNETDYLVRQ